MESSSDSSDSLPPSPRRRRRCTAQFDSTRQFSDRIRRALSHRLLLLHRSGAEFFILGATGNVYTVTLSATPKCSCPDRAAPPCKHALFVLLKVLRVPINNTSLGRRILRERELRRLLEAPTAPESLAGARTRARFHQVFLSGAGGSPRQRRSGTCPVCLEEMEGKEEDLLSCATCGNSVHERCFLKWRSSRGRRAATCVLCRARWKERKETEGYINLEAYTGEEEKAHGGGSCSG